MESDFIKTVLGQVRRQMKTFEVPGYRQSRRVEGMFDRDNELRGFENIWIYIDVALAGREGAISEILFHIDSFVYRQEHYNHTRWLRFFGCQPDDKVVTLRPSTVHQPIRPQAWQGSISSFLSKSPAPGAPLSGPPNLGPFNSRSPGRNDLSVIFCKGKNVLSTEGPERKFAPIRKRALWFSFDDNSDLPEFGAGLPVSHDE